MEDAYSWVVRAFAEAFVLARETESDFTAAWEKSEVRTAVRAIPRSIIHDAQCETELTSHGYTPCRCQERVEDTKNWLARSFERAKRDVAELPSWLRSSHEQAKTIQGQGTSSATSDSDANDDAERKKRKVISDGNIGDLQKSQSIRRDETSPANMNDIDDTVCEHGTALDVHCCNCHSGFIFDLNHECPSTLEELVEDFNGWWFLNREGSVNAAYARIDKFTKAARKALERAVPPATPPALKTCTCFGAWRALNPTCPMHGAAEQEPPQ